MQRDVVGDVGIVGFTHPCGADSGAEEAGIVAGQLTANVVQVEKIGNDTFLQLWMLQPILFATDEEHLRNRGMFEAGEQHAFAHHASGAGDDDVEVGGVWAHGCRIAGLLGAILIEMQGGDWAACQGMPGLQPASCGLPVRLVRAHVIEVLGPETSVVAASARLMQLTRHTGAQPQSEVSVLNAIVSVEKLALPSPHRAPGYPSL